MQLLINKNYYIKSISIMLYKTTSNNTTSLAVWYFVFYFLLQAFQACVDKYVICHHILGRREYYLNGIRTRDKVD